MSVTPLAAGRHSIRGSRPTTQNVEEGFRLEGPGQADASSSQGSAALLLFALSNLAATLSSSVALLAVARVVAALASALYTPNASVAGLAPPEARGRALAIVFGGLSWPPSWACRSGPCWGRRGVAGHVLVRRAPGRRGRRVDRPLLAGAPASAAHQPRRDARGATPPAGRGARDGHDAHHDRHLRRRRLRRPACRADSGRRNRRGGRGAPRVRRLRRPGQRPGRGRHRSRGPRRTLVAGLGAFALSLATLWVFANLGPSGVPSGGPR